MPFREKAKSFFRRSRTDSLTKSSTKDSNQSKERWPSNVYKPGEPMPRPKYRAPPKKEHKEKLEAFSFADAWRRKSFQSQYSPMGTRAPSRRNSWMSMRRKSYRSQKSIRNGSVASAETEKSGIDPKRRDNVGTGAAMAPKLSTEAEAEGDDDVGNVGMSRVQSRERKPASRPASRPLSMDGKANGHANGHVHPAALPPHIQAYDHQPFTEHDLALALKRSHLDVPAQA